MNGRRLTPLAGLVLSFACASSAWAQTTPLAVSLDVEGDAEQAFQWSIDKQVTPTSVDRFIGETQQLGFRLVLTKGSAQERFMVRGDATVTNTSSASVDVTGFTLEYGGELVANRCATGSIAPGASLTCPIEFQADSAAGGTLELTAVTAGGSASGDAAVGFGSPTTTNDSVTVVDPSLDAPLTFSASGTHEYTVDLTCTDGNTRSIKNTATIEETGASDSVSARVACHATRMERVAQPTPGPRWNWDIEKTHAQAGPVRLAAGGSFDVDYTITATATASEGGNVVSGSINVVNTHPTVDAKLVSVEAWIDGIVATPNCPSLTVPKATYGSGGNVILGRVVCPFTLTLPDGHVPKLVTGKVTQQLFDYAPGGAATADGTRVLSGSQAVGAAVSGEIDECVQLGDLYLGTTHDLGQFCASAGNTSVTRNFTGTIRVAADDECEFDVPNLARLLTNDTGTIDQDDTLVSVVRTDCVANEAMSIDLEAEGNLTRTYPWTIDKSVTPENSDRFIGETQQLAYTIRVTRGEAQESGFMITGSASVSNDGTSPITLTSITATYGGAPVTHACAPGTIAAGGTFTCSLSFSAPDNTPRPLVFTVQTSNGNTATQTVDVTFGEPTTTNATITVDDTQLDENLTFSASGTHEYTRDVTCTDGNTRIVDNTATIVETGASDTARARVACHAIRMERSAAPNAGRWTWDIQKTHAQAGAVSLAAGGSVDIEYTITATATFGGSEGGNTVSGSINVLNTHPLTDAQLVSVEAWIDGMPATTNCPSLVVPHATSGPGGVAVPGRLECPFTLSLPEGHVPQLVTGKVTQQLFDYSATGVATADGTKVLQGSQPVSAASAGETDECVRLSDLYLGTTHDLGEFCASTGNTSVTRSFTGTIQVEADDECEFQVANLARLLTNDTGTTDEDGTLVDVVRTDCVANEAMSIDLDARGNLTRTFPWTIEKTVTPERSDRFIGETQELAYTLRVTRGAAQDSGYVVSGNASVSNDGSSAITLTSITVTYGGTPVSHGCVPGPLAAGASLTCPLSFPVPGATPQPLVFTVQTSNGNTATQTVDVAFGSPTTVNETITVDDTLLDQDLTFSESGTHEYTHEVTCVDGTTRVVDNTATIVETGANDSARASVACHAIRMERSAVTGGGTRWSWDVQKTHAQATPLELAAGQTFIVDYTITATASASGSGSGTVSGYIAVLNTHPLVDAQLVSVEAWIDDVSATANCPSLVVPHSTSGAGGTAVPGRLECPFTVTLPDGHVPQMVTGRVTQQLFDYSASGVATADGTKVLQGSQAVTQGGGSGGETDECVRLSDVYQGTTHDLGEFCASAGNTTVTRSFSGAITVAQDAECRYEVPNLARLVTNDSGTTDEDQTLVQVERSDCGETVAACVRTPGYWKTHSAFGPAPYDPTWAAIGENTPFFGAKDDRGRALTWYQVMWLAPKGNAYFNLAPQFVAATLNIEAGATASAQVLDALDDAQRIFESYSVQQIAALRGNAEPRPQLIELAGVLDMYNNGEGSLGPDHCSEDKTSADD